MRRRTNLLQGSPASLSVDLTPLLDPKVGRCNLQHLNPHVVPGSSNGLLPFRPRKSPFLHFGRNHKKTKKEEEKTEAPALDLEEEEEEGALTTVTEKPEETSTRAFKPVRMIIAKYLIKSQYLNIDISEILKVKI